MSDHPAVTVRDESQQPVTDHRAASLAALCATAPAAGPWTFDADAGLIRDVHGYVVAELDYQHRTSKAADNSGRLLAAAPDLLAALRLCYSFVAEHWGEYEDHGAYHASLAAIAKAEGRPS